MNCFSFENKFKNITFIQIIYKKRKKIQALMFYIPTNYKKQVKKNVFLLKLVKTFFKY